MGILHHSENLFKIGVLAGIRFNTFVSGFLNQPVWNILAGMEYANTAVKGLLFMFAATKYPIDEGNH